ncbi:hypothetical protein O6H91_03G046200 [Diphasiastrum complanatum]|uniref:Uncharacterized protein n=1 Tax=Diphasiastrum complanatum TaxID=34168 RepID=A0ACC2E5X0_DIPCM|nr:hypothetical protein O6H91_03G046200 [Diphasiastrum complanatum]
MATESSSLSRALSFERFNIPSKRASLELLEEWRHATFALNAARRFRYTANIKKRRRLEEQKRKFKVGSLATRAALRFIGAGAISAATISASGEKASKLGFDISPEGLVAIVEGRNFSVLNEHGGVERIAAKLKTSVINGIDGDEMDLLKRQAVFGNNTHTEKPPKGIGTFIWEAMQDLTLGILAVCALVSLAVGIPTEGWRQGWYDGAGIGLSILLVVFVTAMSDYQQSLQFRALDKEKRKIFVQVIRGSRRQKVSIFNLVVGDVIHLSIGDQVPADGLFISGYSLLVDESSMTGESDPQEIDSKKPFLLSGTKVQDGYATMLVTGVGMNTEWGHLMAALSEDTNDETPLQVKLNGVASFIGRVGVCFAVLTFLVLMVRYLIQKDDLQNWSGIDLKNIVSFFAIAVTIVVVAVPEGLPLAVTLTLAYAMQKMMADKALVRHLSACETMGSATCICSDKTGTLTTNEMSVVKSWIGGLFSKVDEAKTGVSKETLDLLLQGLFLNTSGDVSEGADNKPIYLGTATETAVLKFGVALGGSFKDVRLKSKVLKVEPFNSAKKRMGIVTRLSDGSFHAHWKGASEIVLDMCDRILDENGNVVLIDKNMQQELKGIIKTFADEALRTLCLAFKDLNQAPFLNDPIPDRGCICVAIIGIKDPLRPGVKDAVQLCFSAGIRVRMVTGDNVNTAIAIARECGILTDGEVIEGPDFRQLSLEELKTRIPRLQVMARSSPTDKHILVQQLRAMEEVVAVTGDGTNDAPALHEADIGLAMGIAGTEVAKESADVVILDDNFSTIVNVAKWGRSVYTNIQKFVQFQLTVNMVALVLNFTSACITGTAPLTAVQLLWVNLIMDTLGALALATEPPYDDLMKLPPVGRHGNFITYVMWRNIGAQAIYQLIVLGVLQYKGKEVLQLTGDRADQVLDTMIFNSFVFCQVFNELNAREMEKLNVFRHTLNNWVFIAVISFTVFFQVVLVEFLGKLANTTPLDMRQWAVSVLIGFFGLFIAVVAKLIPVPSSLSQSGTVDSQSIANGYQLISDELLKKRK